MKRSVTKLTSAPQLSKSISSDGGLLAISSQWMSTNFPRRYKLRWEREDADTEGDLAQTRRERKDSLRFTSWCEIAVVEGDLVAQQRKRSAPIPPAVQHSTDASICVRSLILISCNKKNRISFRVRIRPSHKQAILTSSSTHFWVDTLLHHLWILKTSKNTPTHTRNLWSRIAATKLTSDELNPSKGLLCNVIHSKRRRIRIQILYSHISLPFGSFVRTRCVAFPHASDCSARFKSLSGISVCWLISCKVKN